MAPEPICAITRFLRFSHAMLNLRDALLNSLKSLPGSRELHIHALVSSPRKTHDLFPYATPRPKTWIQDIFILISEQANPAAPRIFVTAVEAYFFIIPSTNSGIFYVSKVDSTGQGSKPSPTSTVVRSLLRYYLDPETRPRLGGVGGAVEKVWVHVFARAQSQYLFPNSADFEGKKPLSDIRLCGWWKGLLSSVAAELSERNAGQGDEKLKLWYLLPGLSDLEAIRTLKSAASTKALDSQVEWAYGHPYAHSGDLPLPCASKEHNLGHFIPSFEDDPKSRFLEEIAHISESDVILSPARKKSRKDYEGTVEEKKEGPRIGELARVTPTEFWERMSFRQECVAGIITGFFVLAYSSRSRSNSATDRSADTSIFTPQPGYVSSNITKRISSSLMTAHEFSTVERAVRGTETLEGAIKGLCEDAETDVPAGRNQGRKTPEQGSPDLVVPPRTPPRNTEGKALPPDVSPNPFPEPTASLETYNSWIYGSICIDNPPVSDGAAGAPVQEVKVTVLAARKKKRKVN
jgi:regulator of Ty1 transposition protein 109